MQLNGEPSLEIIAIVFARRSAVWTCALLSWMMEEGVADRELMEVEPPSHHLLGAETLMVD